MIEFPNTEYSLVFGTETSVHLSLTRAFDRNQSLNLFLFTNRRVGIAIEQIFLFVGYGHLANIMNNIRYDAYPGILGTEIRFTPYLTGSVRWSHIDIADKISFNIRLSF